MDRIKAEQVFTLDNIDSVAMWRSSFRACLETFDEMLAHIMGSFHAWVLGKTSPLPCDVDATELIEINAFTAGNVTLNLIAFFVQEFLQLIGTFQHVVVVTTTHATIRSND